MKTTYIILAVVVILAVGGYIFGRTNAVVPVTTQGDAVKSQVPALVTLSGSYTCLPLLDGAIPPNDCAFGIKTEDGDYYAVNFGASAGSMADFKSGAHITAKGMIILSHDLKPNSWTKFNSKGLFTIMEHPVQK